jgi:hypothetical protein
VAIIRTDVSEDRIASIFRVHECELVTERSCKPLYRHRLVGDCHFPEDDNHHIHRRGNLRSYKAVLMFAGRPQWPPTIPNSLNTGIAGISYELGYTRSLFCVCCSEALQWKDFSPKDFCQMPVRLIVSELILDYTLLLYILSDRLVFKVILPVSERSVVPGLHLRYTVLCSLCWVSAVSRSLARGVSSGVSKINSFRAKFWLCCAV